MGCGVCACCVRGSWVGDWVDIPVSRPQIYRACQDGDVGEVKRGIKAGANLEKLHQGQFTPLYGAARHGHLEVVKLLLQVGVGWGTSLFGGVWFTSTLVRPLSGTRVVALRSSTSTC